MRFTLTSLLHCMLAVRIQYGILGNAHVRVHLTISQIAATLGTFFLAMLLYPDVQRQAQTEIDDAVGKGRLPTPSDIERLPYLQAVFKEALRWHTVACLSE